MLLPLLLSTVYFIRWLSSSNTHRLLIEMIDIPGGFPARSTVPTPRNVYNAAGYALFYNACGESMEIGWVFNHRGLKQHIIISL